MRLSIPIAIVVIFSLPLMLVSIAGAEGGVRIETILETTNVLSSALSCSDCKPFNMEEETKAEAKQRGHPILIIRLPDGKELKFILVRDSNIKEGQIHSLLGKSFTISSAPAEMTP